MTEPTPAGWFDDPEDATQFRYWDGSAWTDHRSPKTAATPGSEPSATPSESSSVATKTPLYKRLWVIAAGVLVLLIIGTAIGGGGGTTETPSKPEAAKPAKEAKTAAPTSAETTAPPASTPVAAAPAETVAEPVAEEPAPPKPQKKHWAKLSSRKFAKIAKNPDNYVGKRYVIYGEVNQFDSATGTDAFLADTGAKKKRIQYGYADFDQNTLMSGTTSQLSDVVEGDVFKANITVLGSKSYETQIGGETTVPWFQVDKIKRYGSTAD